MPVFEVTMKETIIRTYHVLADTAEEAEQTAFDDTNKGEIVFDDGGDPDGCECIEVKEINS